MVDRAPKPQVNPVDFSDKQPGADDEVDLKAIQAKDENIQKVRTWLEQGSRPRQKDILEESHYLKSLWNQWDRLQVHEGLLMRKWEVFETNTVRWQVVIPLKHRRSVLRYSHDIKASGHLGIKKTLARIRQRYYWPGMSGDVQVYVTGCQPCAKRKSPGKSKRAPMQITRSGYPLERIAMDILGELPQTERGNKYVLVVSDYFTKWTESYPLPNIEASTVAQVVVEEFISRFGVPRYIHSDQGRQFVSRVFMEMCKLLQITKTRTTPYHPESDGMVERFNRTLCTMLSAFVDENHRDWDQQLPYVMMAYRSAEHETTGMTPNLMMLGRETSTPLDIIYDMPPVIKSIPVSQWVWELQDSMETAHKFVRTYTGKSINRQKRHHDAKLSYEQLKAGDKVYVFFPVRKVDFSSKFTSYWKGPFEVKEKISDVLYKVNCGYQRSFQIIHVDRLKKVRDQLLSDEHEEPEVDVTDENDAIPAEAETEQPQDEGNDNAYTRSGRRIKMPAWSKDFVFSTSRSEMAKTKNTPRLLPICPSCRESISNENWEQHEVSCSKSRIACDYCNVTFKRELYLNRHLKAKHGDIVGLQKTRDATALPAEPTPSTSTTTGKDDSSSAESSDSESDRESDWEEPDIEIGEEEVKITSETGPLLGRLVRKSTAPEPVFAGKRKMIDTEHNDDVRRKQVKVSKEVQVGATQRDAEMQTEKEQKAPESNLHSCQACGIHFEDITMMYIHRGWHAVGEKFKCNICAKECKDRMDFFIHLTMGHSVNN